MVAKFIVLAYSNVVPFLVVATVPILGYFLGDDLQFYACVVAVLIVLTISNVVTVFVVATVPILDDGFFLFRFFFGNVKLHDRALRVGGAFFSLGFKRGHCRSIRLLFRVDVFSGLGDCVPVSRTSEVTTIGLSVVKSRVVFLGSYERYCDYVRCDVSFGVRFLVRRSTIRLGSIGVQGHLVSILEALRGGTVSIGVGMAIGVSSTSSYFFLFCTSASNVSIRLNGFGYVCVYGILYVYDTMRR